MKTTGERIKFIRERLGMKGETFADLFHVTKGTVSNWENGNRKPDLDVLVKIADLGGCTTDWLLCRTDHPTANVISDITEDGDKVEIEISKDYPYELTASEVSRMIDKLADAGFNIYKLIRDSKRED